MKFERYFTVAGVHPFDEVNWVKTTSQINNKDGEVIFKLENVLFPDFWEQNAIDITVEKYFSKGNIKETSLKDFINRIVNWYTDKGKKDEYFDSDKDADIFRDELTYLLLHQYVAFNTPVNLNVGIQESPQVSACFIISARDTMDSISENMNIEMNIFRKGSGVGSNRSNLRSSRETISSGGKAMGPLIAEQIYDKIANATKSGGASRRAAKMVVLDIDHGDIINFITQKAEVEKAAKALIKAGWNSDFDDLKGVYKLLGLQNFNESVSVFNTFMKAVEEDEEWALLERKNSILQLTSENYPNEVKDINQGCFEKYGEDWYEVEKNLKVIEWVAARDLWALICQAAWECADPGIQFRDIINKWHTCKNDGDIRSSNPCSEYYFLDDTSCNLASHNLLQYLNSEDIFDISGFQHSTRLMITAMDISIHNAAYPTKYIKTKTLQYRTLGLGYTNAGALLLNKLYPYDSDKGRYYLSSITALLLSTAYKTSQEIAEERGAFPRYENNKNYVKEVLNLHKKSMEELRESITDLDNLQIQSEFLSIMDRAYKSFPDTDLPVRNAQTVVIAPTGTISLMMGCETTGLEPMLGLLTYKKMVGGGFKELTIPSIKKVLNKLHYTKDSIEDMLNSIISPSNSAISFIHSLQPEHRSIFATSFGDNNILSPEAHLKMLSAIQPFVSGGISKTVNLPFNATVDNISDIYKKAWELGIKSISVYRDKCKGSQPLNLEKESKKETDKEISIPIRRRLPKDRPGYHHEFQISNQKGFLQFGFYPDTGELGEMFAEISKGGSTINGLMNTVAILISHMLQYGIPVEEIINTFKELKFEPNGITQNPDIKFTSSIPDYIGKYIELLTNNSSEYRKENEMIDSGIELKKSLNKSSRKEIDKEFIEMLDLSGPPCNICGHLMVRGGNCYYCKNCGHTSGCA